MINQIIKLLVATISVIFASFLGLFAIYQQLSGIQEQIIASALGVSVGVVAFISAVISGVRLFIKIRKAIN